ncbi:MAG: SDR family NAD(P)-dependent oxidoreductase [Parcubacteria group bacterium]|nr:SDR family NAD(P)-dependent oxidoreductase [Parcubacteria group bacterium]
MKNIFKNKVILVTGGCGSIGSQIVKQLLTYDPKAIRILERSESAHFKLEQEVKSPKIRNLVGDICDVERVRQAMAGVDIVFHAAAMKHVPFCEYNPFEAVRTNVLGTQNLVNRAQEAGVERFVSISTDKAVNPTSTMGATKLLSEKIVTNAAISTQKTKFCCVRFGNVLASSGSVIPVFEKQIKEGDTITVTSKDMTRFFMGIDDAVGLVLKAAERAERGEIFILKMRPLRIIDLAQVLVEELAPRYGKDPKKMKYKVIGLRPGEKIHEPLMTEDEGRHMKEEARMFVLHNPALRKYGVKIPINKKGYDYNSGSLPPLSKKEIREVLKKKKII